MHYASCINIANYHPMCLAIPAKVIAIKDRQATIDYGDCQDTVISTVEDVRVGDLVQVQMGMIVRILTMDEAIVAKSAWQELTSE